MGRIIKPSEIQTQVNSMISALEKDREMLLETRIETMAFAQTDELQGDAWAGMKDQVSAHDTVIRGLVCMLEALSKAGEKLINESGSEDLNEDELINQIGELEGTRETYVATIESYRSWLNNEMYDVSMGWYARIQITSYERLIDIVDEKIRIAHEKLADIDYIDAVTRDLTAATENLKQTVQQGIEYLSSAWSGNGFAPSAGSNQSWMTLLNVAWSGRTLATALTSDEQIIMDRLQEEFGKEKADADFFNSFMEFCSSGFVGTVTGFGTEILQQLVTDIGAEKIANAINSWVANNTTFFMNRGLVGALATGGEVLIEEAPNLLTQAVRTGSKYAVPIIGTAIDYCIMRANGEEAVDAGIKAVAHTAIGIGGAKMGFAIGAAVGGPLGGAVGVVAGFAIGFVGSAAFDWAYDNLGEIIDGVKDVGKKAKEVIDDVGDAVSGFFSGIAGIFT